MPACARESQRTASIWNQACGNEASALQRREVHSARRARRATDPAVAAAYSPPRFIHPRYSQQDCHRRGSIFQSQAQETGRQITWSDHRSPVDATGTQRRCRNRKPSSHKRDHTREQPRRLRRARKDEDAESAIAACSLDPPAGAFVGASLGCVDRCDLGDLVGLVGYVLMRLGYQLAGLATAAIYGALGLDGIAITASHRSRSHGR